LSRDYNPDWTFPEERHDPLIRARRIAVVLMCLLDPEDALHMATNAASKGEGWLLDGYRRNYPTEPLAEVVPLRRPG
jgi:hypothetical protein